MTTPPVHSTTTLAMPETFPDVLKSFTRELLREAAHVTTASSIHAFGVQYFQSLLAAREEDGSSRKKNDKKERNVVTRPRYTQMSASELQALVLQAFQHVIVDNTIGSAVIDHAEFYPMFMALADKLELEPADVTQVLVEIDETTDGRVDVHAFVPSAVDVLLTLRNNNNNVDNDDDHHHHSTADEIKTTRLWHGMTRAQLTSVWLAVGHRVETTGRLNRESFLQSSHDRDLGLTSKERHSIAMTLDPRSPSSFVSLEDHVMLALDILEHVHTRGLLDVPTTVEECHEYLTSVYENDDENEDEMSLGKIQRGLYQAELGLTRMQIHSLMGDVLSWDARAEEPVFTRGSVLRCLCPSILTLVALPQASARVCGAVQAFRSSPQYHLLGQQNQYQVELALQSTWQELDASGEGRLALETIMDGLEHTLELSEPEFQLRVLRTLAEDYLEEDRASVAYFDLTKQVFPQLQQCAEQRMILRLDVG